MRNILTTTRKKAKKLFRKLPKVNYRLIIVAVAIIVSDLGIVLQPFFETKSYALGSAESLLPKKNPNLSSKLSYDTSKRLFSFSSAKVAGSESANIIDSTGIKATLNEDVSKGVTVIDPIHNVDFGIKPLDKHTVGRRDGNRVVYPFQNGRGWTVYTAQANGIKEDVILTSSETDMMTVSYELSLGDGLEARLENDGSIGVYGNTLLSGSVTAASESDAKLLEAARKNAEKDTLLFTIPKPIVIEANKEISNVQATYVLDGNKLDIAVSGLSNATYPLSIDPTIFVATAQQFMAGNNETNINFNVDEELIEKGRTTGARFDTWNATTSLPSASWASGATVAGGYTYSVGGIMFPGQIFNSQGTDSFVVPAGVTSLTLKLWGAGGGGGGGGSSGVGGDGGGGGYTLSTISVTPGETLSIYVGGGGAGGSYSSGGTDAGGGGGGGGFTSVYRGGSALTIAAGGGGGGGARRTIGGGDGGAGGGTTGIAGTAVGAGGGGAGTPTTGGAGGTSSNNPGTSGASLSGGAGADGRSSAGADGSGAAGGLVTGGDGGSPNIATTRAGGGGGGSGYFGGGGGGASTSNNSQAGGGGGGASSYTDPGSTSVTNTAGSGTNPGNSADVSRSGAGNGGTGGSALGNGATGAGGIAILTYGSGSTTTAAVNWAQFNTSTGTIDSANPGSGACSGWCTNSAYNLPSARSNFSLVAYSGYLYAFGGIDSAGTRQNTVYIAKLGANGEPRLWHPTDTNPNNWVYWYQDTNLSSSRSDMGVAAYNNRMYLVGGRTGTSAYTNTVEIADINPNGTLGSWSSGTALSANVYGHSLKIYNDRMYVIGGAASIAGSPLATIQYTKINSNGTINSWVSANNMPSGRMNTGGDFATVWGAYIYISGGCTTTNASGYCTSIQSNTQVASINADGSLDTWSTMANVTDTRTGGTLLSWRDRVYEVGGCSSQNTTTGDCNASMLDSINYGSINQDGDASTVDQSVASGTAPCSGGAPVECNLPGTANIGNMLNSSFISNGYLYIVGGCTNNTCSTTSGNLAYVAISSTGQMSQPAVCTGGTYQGGAWCVNTTNAIAGGLAASSPVVFNNRVYLVGGLDGGANTNDIHRADINNDGSLSAWSSQTMTGLGMNSVSYLFAYARSNPSSAGTNPGNLYVFGGCSTSSAAGCTAYSQNVYKCSIQVAGTLTGCTTTGQLQIGTIPGDTATGLGIMSGTVYANYIYLIGGVSPNQVDLKTVRYAKFDDSNNVVTAGTGWVESPNLMAVGRRRAAAFGYNGYLYVVGGYEATSGVLADIEFIKINVSDGSIGSATDPFEVSSVSISQRWGLSVPVSNSFAYVIGGCTAGASPGGCSTRTDIIQTFQIYNNDSGAPAGYSTSANTFGTSPNRIGASSTVLNGYIYNAGGCTSTSDCTTAINTVSYAPIDVNGVVGTWTNTTANLPAVRAFGKLRSAGGSLYYMGGQSSTATDFRTEVYYAAPSSGNVTTWNTASNGLPAGRSDFGATTWNNRLYVIGGKGTGTGCTGSNVCNTVYVSPQLNAGGNIGSAWSTSSTSFDVARSGGTAVAYANNLYLMGGNDGTNYLSDVQYSKIDPTNGTAGTWIFTASLPGPLAGSDGFAANGYLYLMGGRSSATVCDPVTLVAPISANTTIASGNNPTGIGEWYETNQRYTGARYGGSAVYYEGKAYVVGGACGSTLTYASPVIQQTTLLAQPQVAKYSYAIDTDSDVYPAYWLLNGVDNAIGAKWQLRYRSMTNPITTLCTSPAMTTWGQETVFGDVTLGLPGAYTPKNSAGTNTNCARYYYFNVTVDSSQAFGYPDDVTRGPTITDLTLQFTADPSKRLLHGRTFTGGLQQPIDTPLYSF